MALPRSGALTLKIPDNPHWVECQLSLVGDGDHTAVKFSSTVFLQQGTQQTCGIWRGILSTADKKKVVVKVATDKAQWTRLQHECQMYTGPLRALEGGRIVPTFHGLYVAENPIEGELYGSIILGDYGDPYAATWDDLKKALQKKGLKDINTCLDAIECLHDQAKIVHGDISPGHILAGPEGPVFISFSAAGMHTCKRPSDELVIGGLEPDYDSFNCVEMWDLCIQLGVWRPKTLLCFGEPHVVDDYMHDPRALAHCSPSYFPAAKALASACVALRAYKREHQSTSKSLLLNMDDRAIESLSESWEKEIDTHFPGAEWREIPLASLPLLSKPSELNW